MPQQTAAEDTRDQCVSLPGADSSVATITSSTSSSRLQARDTSELPFWTPAGARSWLKGSKTQWG